MSAVRTKVADTFSTVQLGFWLYLMTDLMLFASLFATYLVLKPGTAGGVTPSELFDAKYALVETLLLLTSSFTAGLALLAARFKNRAATVSLLLSTLLLGAGFLFLELREFHAFVLEGHSWQASAFLSGFFTLVGTHGAHIFVGLLWGAMLCGFLLVKGLTGNLLRKLSLFVLFWHFLDLVWIFIFTIVYLMGVAL